MDGSLSEALTVETQSLAEMRIAPFPVVTPTSVTFLNVKVGISVVNSWFPRKELDADYFGGPLERREGILNDGFFIGCVSIVNVDSDPVVIVF